MDKRNKSSLVRALAKLYPEPRSELNFSSGYQLLVSVMLSAQCTDKKVNEVTPALFSKFPSFEHLSRAKVPQVEAIVRPINYYRTKARNLISTAKAVVKNFDGEIPLSFDKITTLPGIGRKSANVILGELGAGATLPVDTHVFRVSKRLGLASGKNPIEVEKELMSEFPAKTWRSLHHWLIFHGRRVCKAQRPLCSQCSISDICPSRG